MTRNPNADLIGLLDIGTTAVRCAIAELEPHRTGAPRARRIVGFATTRSFGINSGVVVNPDAAEEAVRKAVAQAERMAGCTISRVVATVTCGRITSHRFKAHADVAGSVVTREDLARLHAGAESYAARGGRTLIHWAQTGIALDGEVGVESPVGMVGQRLTGHYNTVSADEGPIRNLVGLIQSCVLEVAALVPAPIATAVAVTRPDERAEGITVVDVGGGTMSYATFQDHQLLGCGVLRFGGLQITKDIARRLGVSEAEAERLKVLEGSLVTAPSDRERLLELPREPGDERDGLVSVADLNAIIARRAATQFAGLRDMFADTQGAAPDRLVVAGGGSRLGALAVGLGDDLGRPVRLGQPAPVVGLPADMTHAALSAVFGLSAFVPRAHARTTGDRPVHARDRYMDRIQKWVLETF